MAKTTTKMTREEYLKKAQEESAALLAQIEAEMLATVETEQANAQPGQSVEYIPDGGGEVRRTRSGRWLLDLD